MPTFILQRTLLIPRERRMTEKGTESKCEKCKKWYSSHCKPNRVCPLCGYDHINELSEGAKLEYLSQFKDYEPAGETIEFED